VYACGPLRMLDALEGACAAWPEGALRVEHFESTLATLDPSKEQAFEVELKDSGLVLTVPPDQTLLSALRAANVDVQSDCEEGLCGSCEVRVLSGKVDHRDVVLTRMEREANTKMMACCSRACKEQGQGQGPGQLQGRLVLEL
jgi:ferredoxin